jgi:DNA-directed RNA polymerase specialized sigma24 family protein
VAAELFQALEPELDALYDMLMQVFGDEEASQELLQRVLRQARKQYRHEKYDRYLRLWIFRICAQNVQRHYERFLAELPSDGEATFPFLSLEEKLVLTLHDRVGFSYEDTAACLRISVGRAGRSITYAREKLARFLLGVEWRRVTAESDCHLDSLLARVEANRDYQAAVVKKEGGCPSCEQYNDLILKSQTLIRDLPAHRFSEIEKDVRTNKFLSIFRKRESFAWSTLPMHWKLGAEISALGLMATAVVFSVPWFMDHVSLHALISGNFSNVVQFTSAVKQELEVPTINAERLLASSDLSEQEMSAKPEEKDEFADITFPSGDAYETGAAPLAPSRQSAAVFRLIVQSPNPRELIPEMKRLFSEDKVRERESSGRVMPGGVYFDGLTNVGAYPDLLGQIKKLGITKTYSNPANGRSPDERARLIVWIQQI